MVFNKNIEQREKKMNTTLLIMAAGIGSRFGTGIKQLEPVDDANHIIMDYSIHDAIEAGFNHVVFIIRKDIEKEFKEVIGDRIASICSSHNVTVDYAFQHINDIPGELPEGRTKPWGTGQAVLAAKKVIKTPFIVINADDYYGKEGFKAVHEYLVNGGKSCMAGFVLKNTLSDNGGVTRGICKWICFRSGSQLCILESTSALSDAEILCESPAGFSGVFCDVLEFRKDYCRSSGRADPGGSTGSVGICQISFSGKKFAVYDLCGIDDDALSGNDAQ